jgi:hypothetical protein
MRGRFSRLAVAVIAVAVVAIAGAVTYAVADIGGGGVINGCFKSQNGQLRLIDPATDSCNPSERSISWNQTGPAGAKGATGARGVTGATGPPGAKGATGANGTNGAKGATGPKGATGANGLNGAKGATGPRGPQGLSGLPQTNRFTPTQIIEGAILTCTTPSGTTASTNCQGPQLNGMDIRLGFPELVEICDAVTGPHNAAASGAVAATAPYFIWNGSNWALSSTVGFNAMQSIACATGTSVASAAAQRSSTRTGSHRRIVVRYGAHG